MSKYPLLKDALLRSGCPKAALKPQPASNWKGSILLPPEVQGYYRELGPVDLTLPGLGNDYFLPRLSKLWEYQAGYPSGDEEDLRRLE